MKTFTTVTIALVVLALPFHLTHAQAKTGAPTVVLISPVCKPSAWSVTFTYPEEANPSGAGVKGRIRTLALTEVGQTVHIQIIRTEGLTQDMWKAGNEEFGKNSNTSDWARLTGISVKDNPYFLTSVYPGTEWIKSDYYLGVIKYQDVDCQVFMKDPPPGLDISNDDALKQALQTAPFSAIVSQSNHLPVEVHTDSVKEVFTYQTPPTKLSFPGDLVDQINEGNEVRAALSRRAPRPY